MISEGKAGTTPFSAGGSSAVFDPAQGGLTSWTVDGTVNQLALQNFWFNVGGNNLALSSLGSPSVTVATDSASTSTLTAIYGSTAFNVTLTYTLTDFGNGSADIGESIGIQNNRPSALNLSLIQYSDFNLDGTPGGDTAELTMDPFWGRFLAATQWKGTTEVSSTVEQSAITPEADLGEVDGNGGLYSRISSGAYSLNSNNSGPVTGSDVSWALQWDLSLGGMGTTGISEQNEIAGLAVPEPSTFAIAFLGLFGLGLRFCGRRA
jgi:hypothetical protein